jgi:hypothetical protein
MPPLATQADPMLRPLKRGEVGVSFFPSGTREILPETEFTLVDRSFQPGDYCKRSVDDVQSGVVTRIRMECRLEHAISGEPVDEWIAMQELETAVDPNIGDYVVYDDWIGQARRFTSTLSAAFIDVPFTHSGHRGKIGSYAITLLLELSYLDSPSMKLSSRSALVN